MNPIGIGPIINNLKLKILILQIISYDNRVQKFYFYKIVFRFFINVW